MIALKLSVFDISEEEFKALSVAMKEHVSKRKFSVASPRRGDYHWIIQDLESEKAFSKLQAILTPLVSNYFYQFWVYQKSGASLKIGDITTPSDCFTVVSVGNAPA